MNAIVSLCMVLGALATLPAQATEVHVHIKAPAGHQSPVAIRKAELLLAWWGDTAIVPLQTRVEKGEVTVLLPLGPDVWRSAHGQPPDFGYVYLEFADFVPVRSERFHWLGGYGPDGVSTASEIRLRFPGGEAVVVREGEQRDVSVPLRLPSPRQLRLLDTNDRPVTDVTVDGWVFWSDHNHCGVLSGKQSVMAGIRPDADGVVPVPDGDIEYAFAFRGNRHLSVEGPRDFFTMTFVSPEQLVRIRRHRSVALRIRVTREGKPSADVPVGAAAPAACGNGTGLLGRTDARGVLVIPEFYPDEVEAICIANRSGQPLWSEAPPRQPDIAVNLPADAQIGEPLYCHVR